MFSGILEMRQTFICQQLNHQLLYQGLLIVSFFAPSHNHCPLFKIFQQAYSIHWPFLDFFQLYLTTYCRLSLVLLSYCSVYDKFQSSSAGSRRLFLETLQLKLQQHLPTALQDLTKDVPFFTLHYSISSLRLVVDKKMKLLALFSKLIYTASANQPAKLFNYNSTRSCRLQPTNLQVQSTHCIYYVQYGRARHIPSTSSLPIAITSLSAVNVRFGACPHPFQSNIIE